MPAFLVDQAMRIYHWHSGFRFDAPAAIAVGNFDGVHIGHQAMLQKLQHEARVRGLKALAVSLYPHPKAVLTGKAPALLTGLRDRAYWLTHYGMEQWLLLPFTASLRRMPAEDFIKDVLIKGLQARYILAGDDFRFGSKGAGDFALLQAMAGSYEAESLSTVTDAAGRRISSSAIRNRLDNHDLQGAQALLGHPLTFTGTVRKGAGRGRQMQTRTANVHVPEHWCLPDGVYVVKLRLCPDGEAVWGVANLGGAPTFNSSRRKLEAHAFADIGEVYGRQVQISFHQYLRGVIKFAGEDELKAQIQQDIQAALAFCAAQQ